MRQGAVISISAEALRKVNAIREQADLGVVDEQALRQLLDWTDLVRSPNLTAACLPRFAQVLGCRVTNNTDGGMLYLCLDSKELAMQLGLAIGGLVHEWTSLGPLGPRDFLGHTVLLPDDVVDLAKQASTVVRDVWYNRP